MLFSSSGGPGWLVVFLGNPGPKYDFTRHNAGFLVCDALAKKKGFAVNRLRFSALTAQVDLGGEKVLVMKPQTFMNLSGDAVGQAVRFYKIPADHVLVVSDEVSLPPGKLRIRTNLDDPEGEYCLVCRDRASGLTVTKKIFRGKLPWWKRLFR